MFLSLSITLLSLRIPSFLDTPSISASPTQRPDLAAFEALAAFTRKREPPASRDGPVEWWSKRPRNAERSQGESHYDGIADSSGPAFKESPHSSLPRRGPS
jgi:hypothetical protein